MSEQRTFTLPLDTLKMSERRIMASKFGVNWDNIQVSLAAEMPEIADPDNPTEAENLAVARVFTKVIGPEEHFALLFIAARRIFPSVTEAEVEQRADDGEWSLELGEEGAAPLGEVPGPSEQSLNEKP